MADISLTPIKLEYVTVKAKPQNFNALKAIFAEKMSDYKNTDSVRINSKAYPTSFEYSVLGWNEITPITPTNLLEIDDGNNKIYAQPIGTKLDSFKFLYNSTSLGSGGFYGANFFYMIGIIIAEFSDGQYTFGWINNGYNPNNPPYNITLQPPTTNGFGYALISANSAGSYGSSLGALGFSDLYKNSAKVIINSIIKKNVDPYEQGGVTEKGGGTGTFDGTSTPVSIPNLPTLSAVDTGFITLFNPTLSEMKNLANYMWSDLFDLDGWKKIFADPMNAILGLSLVPVSVPDGGQKTVTVGNISTGVSMNKAGSQFVTVDCGSIEVKEFWGSYLDYAPFTKSELYLPYCGTHPIDIDDIMGKTIHVVYHVDILSGACCAYVQCGESVLYTFVGQCSVSIPITGNDWTNVVNGALTIGASIGTMVATGGASAPMATQTIASTAVNSLKPSVEKSGALSGMGGMLANQTPYLIITLPRQAVPENQNTFMGYPSFVTVTLSECSGYTEVDRIHLENVNATDKELDEIELLLKSGVII